MPLSQVMVLKGRPLFRINASAARLTARSVRRGNRMTSAHPLLRSTRVSKATSFASCAHGGIALPVPQFKPRFNRLGTLVDHRLVRQFSALYRPERALSSPFPAMTQVPEKIAATPLVLADMAVDRGVAHVRLPTCAQLVGQLLGAPLLGLQLHLETRVYLCRVVSDLANRSRAASHCWARTAVAACSQR